MKRNILVTVGLASMLILTIVAPGNSHQESVIDYIQKGDAAYFYRYLLPPDTISLQKALAELKEYEPFLKEAIFWYEKAWKQREDISIQLQVYVANRLSQLKYELTTYLNPEDKQEKEKLFEEGKEYGFESLRLNPNFKAWESKDFSKAVSFVTDPAALLWTANNWGSWLGYHPLQGLVNIEKIKIMYERVLEIEETYWGASAHNALGALLMTTPGFLGGNKKEGKRHLEKALDLFPNYLTNHAVYAEYWGFVYDWRSNKIGIRRKNLEGQEFNGESFIKKECEFILKEKVGKDWPFWNRVAKKSAQIVLERLEELKIVKK